MRTRNSQPSAIKLSTKSYKLAHYMVLSAASSSLLRQTVDLRAQMTTDKAILPLTYTPYSSEPQSLQHHRNAQRLPG